MDTIQLRSARKRISIQDEAGKVRGEIVINPGDELFAAKMYRLVEEMTAKYNELQERSAHLLGNGNAEAVAWEQMPELIALNNEAWSFITERIDDLFGAGTTEMVFQGEREREILEQFFAGVLIHFQSARSEKIARYIPPVEKPVKVVRRRSKKK